MCNENPNALYPKTVLMRLLTETRFRRVVILDEWFSSELPIHTPRTCPAHAGLVMWSEVRARYPDHPCGIRARRPVLRGYQAVLKKDKEKIRQWKQEIQKGNHELLYFVWSPPWHVKTYLDIYFIYSDNQSGIYSDILSGMYSGILSGIHSGNLSDIYSDILSGILSDIYSDILSDIYSDILSGILSGILSDIYSGILSGILSGMYTGWSPAVPTAIWSSQLKSGSAHCDLGLAVAVRQCPLGSGSRCWSPAVPTGIWRSRLKSGSAHWDLEVAAEARQCPLGSGARGWSPAVPTAIWSWQMKSGSAHCDLELADEVRQCPLQSGAGEEAEEETAEAEAAEAAGVAEAAGDASLIKSSNPHLAGGEKK